jgi:hypothetical protein
MATLIKQRTLLAGNNIFSTYGCLLQKGAYKAFLGATEYKKAVSNESRNESGTRYSAVSKELRHLAERELSITLVTTAADEVACIANFDALCSAASDGIVAWSVPAIGKVFNLILTKRATPEFYPNGALITATQQITLTEPDPTNRTTC